MTISIVFRMTISKGTFEIEEVASKPVFQIIIPLYLYFYSIHRGYIENGLEAGPSPLTFITIVSITSRANMIYVIIFGSIIVIIDFFDLISNIRNSINPSFNQRLSKSISVIQNTIAQMYALSPNDSDKLLRWFISGINIMIEILDFPALIVQHDVMDTLFASLLRRWMRGVTITYLSIAVATDVIKKLISKYQIQTKNTRKVEIGLKGKIINYVILSTVVLADAAIASDEIIIVIGIIGLVIQTVTKLIANFIDVLYSTSQTPSNNFEKEEALLAPGSPKNILTENTFAREGNRIALPQPMTSTFVQSSCNSPYISRQQIRQRRIAPSVLAQCSHIPWHCSNTSSQCNKQAGQAGYKIMANTRAKTMHYIYEMRLRTKHCGVAVIINNEEFKAPLETRSGSTIVAHNLSNLFNSIGFDTQCHKNKSHTEMRQILNNVAGMDYDKYDCLMVAILTHGDYMEMCCMEPLELSQYKKSSKHLVAKDVQHSLGNQRYLSYKHVVVKGATKQ